MEYLRNYIMDRRRQQIHFIRNSGFGLKKQTLRCQLRIRMGNNAIKVIQVNDK